MVQSLKDKLPKSWPTYFLICTFGIGSWIAVNGIWAEISILVNSTPECDKLPSVLVVIIQIANLGPLFYGLIRYLFYRFKLKTLKIYLESGAIIVLILIGIASCILLSFLWNLTSVIHNNEHSMALLILTFFLSLVDCTSSVLFVPFMKNFPAVYMTALYIGEGLSGLLPSLFALSQGSVNNNISCKGNYTGHEDLGIRFGPDIYFVFLGGMMVICGVSFVLVIALPAIRKHMVDNKYNLNSLKQARSWMHSGSVIHTSGNETLDEQVNLYQDQKISRKNSPHEDQCHRENMKLNNNILHFSFANMCRTLKSNFAAYACLTVLSFLTNSALSAVAPFAFLPYGNNVYHITINIALLVNPVMSILFISIPLRSTLINVINTAIVSIMGVYVLIMAQSPYPDFQAQFFAKFLVVRLKHYCNKSA